MRVIDQFLLSSTILATFAAASPIRRTEVTQAFQKRDRFTIHQTKSRNGKRPGPEALAKAHKKYRPMPGYQPTQSTTTAVASATGTSTSSAASPTGTTDGDSDPDDVTATPSAGDDEYTAVVMIGGQEVHLDFDTGSSDLWIYSNELPADEQDGHDIYTPTANSSEQDGLTWSIQYGDGSSASGNVYTDTVSVGAATVQGQAIELAESISTQFQNDFNNDGLMGLAFDSLNSVSPTQQRTFFSNVKDSLEEPLFTADLRHQQPGSYDFGFVNSSKYSGDLVYVDADSSNGFWGVQQTGFQIGGDGTSMTSSSASAIVDTGTTLLLAGDDLVTAYYAQVSGSQNSSEYGGFVFPCDSTLPNLFFGFPGYTAEVDAQYMNFGFVSSSDTTTCYGGLQASGSTGTLEVILGDVFLKSIFVVFKAPSGGNPTLGFAYKGNSTGGGATSSGSPLGFVI
ncbi:Type I transmembrane sorting receptor [Agyrium rufum]|nr:Type I transmembrane sorting receptor [Agyrium rufum]